MQKILTAKSFKFYLAFFAATMMCAMIYAFPASAAGHRWNDVHGGTVPANGDSIDVSYSTTGTYITIPANVSVTFTGITDNNLTVYLDSGASFTWTASVTGAGSVTVGVMSMATGTSASFIGADINTSASPAVSIASGVGSVTFSNSAIETSGGTGISAYGGTITLSGGTTVTASTPVNVGGDVTLEINGATLDGGSYGVTLLHSGATLKMTSGLISGVHAINAYGAEKIEISGGTIQGETASGIGVFPQNTPTTISGGIITSENQGLNISGSAVKITGGTISATASYGQGIHCVGGSLDIEPTASTPVLVKGTVVAIDDFAFTTTYSNVHKYITSEEYSGTPQTATETATAPFVNSSAYKYIQFFAPVPYVAPAPEPEPAPVYAPVEIIYQPIPLIDYPDPENLPEWIEVTATLNKSGTVNGAETAEDVAAAHRRSARQGGGKIKLVIPENGTGISKTAMQKIFKAAEETPVYLTFDLYEKGENAESVGNVIFKLTGKTGQVLTRVDFDSVRIDSAESDIAKRFKTDILGSFEFSQKYGWGETATVTLNPESLGIDIHNGQKITAYTYNAKTGKWYKITGKAANDLIIMETAQPGVITFVK
jgi:hypothetical protein